MSDGSGDGLFSPVREESLKSYPPIAEVCVGEIARGPLWASASRDFLSELSRCESLPP